MKRVALLFVLLLSAMFAVAQAPKPGSIEGVITRTGSTEPISNVTVALAISSLSARNTTYKITTDSAGKFVIEGVPPGRYNLITNGAGFYRPQRSGPLTVVITAGERLRDVRVSMTPGATVSGKVLDENGEPAAAQMELMEVGYQDGTRTMGRDRQTARLPTNDKGEFRIPDAHVGRYFLRALPTEKGSLFLPVYYPGVARPEDAVPINIGPGADLRGLDFQLVHKDVHRVRLKVSTLTPLPGGTPITFALRPKGRSYQVGGLVLSFELSADGNYVSPVMSAGEYDFDIAARPAEKPNWPVHQAHLSFEIRDKDVDLGTVTLKTGPSISGKVTFKDVPFPSGNLGVRLTGLDSGDWFPPNAPVDASGSFVVDRVPVERLMKVAVGVPAGLYVESARYAGKDVLVTGIVITEDKGPLDIVVTGPAGVVTGTVKNAREEPFAQIRVVLVPLPNRRGPATRFQIAMSDESGNFSISDVPAGEYGVLALEDNMFYFADSFSFVRSSEFYEDPEFLREFEAKAVKVEVERGGTHNVTLHSVLVPDYR